MNENKKHLSMEALLNQGRAETRILEQALEKHKAFLENVEASIHKTALGRYAKLAEQAYEILQRRPKLIYSDWANLGAVDANTKKRVLTELKMRHSDVKIDIRKIGESNRQAYTAWIDDQKLEQSERDPDYEIGKFIQETNPTREQLNKKFGWDAEISNKQVGRLLQQKKIFYDGLRYTWTGPDCQTTSTSLPSKNDKNRQLTKER